MDTRKIIAKNIKALMAYHGDTQLSLAKKSGVSQTFIGRILREESDCSSKMVAQIAKHYNKPNGYLLNEQNEEASIDTFLINFLIEGTKHLDQDTRFEFINRYALEEVMNEIPSLTDKKLDMLISIAMAEKVRRHQSVV